MLLQIEAEQRGEAKKFKSANRSRDIMYDGMINTLNTGGVNCFVDVRAPATETIEPSSSDDDDDSSDGNPDFSSNNEDSSEAEQSRSSTSKHSRCSDPDEQRLLAYKKEGKS
ncbi:MAG: hypothetical protein M1839_001352 [Geoglossum umbratile]|nr:MAG: hypothetical protein M1839_001352 [Geoglossum umbratile]